MALSRSLLADGLPPELLLLVCENLTLLSGIQLGLTCRKMYNVLQRVLPVRASRQLDVEDKLRLLTNLEKDNPTLIYCDGCHLLRKLQYEDASHSSEQWEDAIKHAGCWKVFLGYRVACDHHWTWEPTPSYTKDKLLERVSCDVWHLAETDLQMSFFEAHAVMHRHFHGEPHGLPIEGLRKSFRFDRWLPANDFSRYDCNHWPLERHPAQRRHLTRSQYSRLCKESRLLTPSNLRRDRKLIAQDVSPELGVSPSDGLVSWQFEHDFDAAVIDDELYIRRTHRVSCAVPAGQEISLQAIQRFRLPICRHAHTWDKHTFKAPASRCRRPDYRAPGMRVPAPLDESVDRLVPEFGCLRQKTLVHHRALRSCPHCYTDYTVTIDWGYAGHHSLELSTYHRIGRCRTVNERAWQALGWFSAYWSGTLRIEDVAMFGLGAIHSRWHRSRHESIEEWTGIIPHWTKYYFDARYNPWLEAKFIRLANTEELDAERERAWFCGREPRCPKHKKPYETNMRPSFPPCLWKDIVRRANRVMKADLQATIQARTSTEPGLRLPTMVRRAAFSDEVNDDKFVQPFAG